MTAAQKRAKIARQKREYTQLVAVELLSQKEAAKQVGISKQTACKWYADLLHLMDGKEMGMMVLLKKQLAALISQQGMTQAKAAGLLGISKQTACKWVKTLGGMAVLKKQYEMQHGGYDDTASDYIAYMGGSDTYKHLYPTLIEGYKAYQKTITLKNHN